MISEKINRDNAREEKRYIKRAYICMVMISHREKKVRYLIKKMQLIRCLNRIVYREAAN